MDNQVSPAEDTYHDLLDYIKSKRDQLQTQKQIDISNSYDYVDEVIPLLKQNNSLVRQATKYYNEDDLYISHSVNVTIFTLFLAIKMNYEDEFLERLLVVGLNHDIGIARMPARILKKGKGALGKNELFYFKQHPKMSYNSIEKFNPELQKIGEMILQHHERQNGKGYPEGLSEEKLSDEVKILGLADIYESLIHPRTKRDALFPPLGMEDIFYKAGDSFDEEILATLYDNLFHTIKGTYVKLSSGTIAKITEVKQNNPTDPIVEPVFSSEGKELSSNQIDLSREENLHIKHSVPIPLD